MEPLLETIANRPYVMAFVAVFWIVAPAEVGWRRACFWFVSGTLLGWLTEFSSTRTGFPFGHYAYHGHLSGASGRSSATWVFMLVVTLQLMRNPAVPAGTPLGALFVSGALLTSAFVLFAAPMIRRGFARPLPPH